MINLEPHMRQTINTLLLAAIRLLLTSLMMANAMLISAAAFAAVPPVCSQSAQQQNITQEVLKKLDRKYHIRHCFTEGLAAVKLDGKYGYVDTTGNLVLPLIYEHARPFKEGLASVSILQAKTNRLLPWQKTQKYGFINHKGAWVIAPTFDKASDFAFERAVVGKRIGKKNGRTKYRYGYIDHHGTLVIDYKYDKALTFLRRPLLGLADEKASIIEAQVSKTNTQGITLHYLIDRHGKLTTPIGSEDNNFYFSGGLARVKVGGKYGFINRRGEFVIPAKYQLAYSFNEKREPAAVQNNDFKWGFIDPTGNTVLPFIYDHAFSFDGGIAKTTKQVDGQYHNEVIDMQGNIIASE